MSVLIFLGAVLLLYGIWTLTVKWGLKSLGVRRSFSGPAFFEGQEGRLVEVVRNDRPFIIPWLRVESYISPHIRLGKREDMQAGDRMHYCSLFTLLPYQQVRRTHQVKFLRRGSYDLGNAALTCGDMLGIFQFLRTQALTVPVLVYPRLLGQEKLPLPMSRLLGELVRRRQLLTDPFLIRGIRPYQPGDPVRDIHWPATARTGQVQVRVHDYSARTRLLVVLNVQSEDVQWRDRVPERDAQALEYGISLAASLCVHALRAGLAAGFAANMPQEQGEGSTVLLPEDGAAQEERLLAACARLQTVRSEKFPAFLESLEGCSGLDVLVLSRYDSQSIRTAMERLGSAGNQVSLHVFGEGGL